MRRFILLLVCVWLPTCRGVEDSATGDKEFEPTAFFTDSVASVGRLDEENPLFIYRSPFPVSLLDSQTVAFGESTGSTGRLVVANMVTGDGWEVASPSGAAGPGELDGQQPLLFVSGDTVQAVLPNGSVHTWHRDGRFLSTVSVDPAAIFGFDGTFDGAPVGGFGTRIVTLYRDAVDFSVPDPQTLTRGIRVYDVEDGLLADVREGTPSDLIRIVRDARGRSSTEDVRPQVSLATAARRGIIVHGVVGSHTIVVRDASGSTTASRDLAWPLEELHVDADRRIWAAVQAPSQRRGGRYLVLDERLDELFRVVHLQVIDASGNSLLTRSRDEATGLVRLTLLRAVDPVPGPS